MGVVPAAWCAVVLVVFIRTCYASPWTWGQASIGGGGYVSGIIAHPTEPDLIYTRCDVGGVYRFDFEGRNWVPLLDAFGPSQKNLYGGDSFAIDPNNPDVLYVSAGMYNYWGNGDVIKSNDRGETWEFTNLNLAMGSNQDIRWAGERLIVNPKNSNIVYYGSRYDGLWVKNGNDSWQLVKSLPSNGTAGYGVAFLVFDGDTMYAGVYDSGIYISGDSGLSWKLLSGSPSQAIRAIVPIPGSLIATAISGVWKFANGTWTNITPVAGQQYGGITVHPTNPLFMLVAQRAGIYMCGVYRTTNGGKTWDNLTPTATIKDDVPWWTTSMFAAATAGVLIDPTTPSRAYLTTWFGVYFCDNISQINTTWYTQEKGHEEVFAISLHTPTNGGVYVGTADVVGFKLLDYNSFPTVNFNQVSDFDIQDSDSIDSSVKFPNVVVRVGTNNGPMTGNGGFSLDNGQTWKKFPTLPVPNNYPIGGSISISADNSTIVWWPFQNHPFYSNNFGATWISSTGGPFNNNSCCNNYNNVGIDAAYSQALSSDKVNSSVFYIFDSLSGMFLTSTDSAHTWVNTSSLSHVWNPTTFANVNVKAAPGWEGEVWINLGPGGLWRSSNFGKSFTQIGNVTSALLFAFGKSAPASESKYARRERVRESETPMVYMLGAVGEVEGVFASKDFGVSWEYISDPKVGLGDNPWSMAADMESYGTLFVGTLGRGVYVATAT